MEQLFYSECVSIRVSSTLMTIPGVKEQHIPYCANSSLAWLCSWSLTRCVPGVSPATGPFSHLFIRRRHTAAELSNPMSEYEPLDLTGLTNHPRRWCSLTVLTTCRNGGDNGNEGGSSDKDGFELNHFVFMIKRTCEFEKEWLEVTRQKNRLRLSVEGKKETKRVPVYIQLHHRKNL